MPRSPSPPRTLSALAYSITSDCQFSALAKASPSTRSAVGCAASIATTFLYSSSARSAWASGPRVTSASASSAATRSSELAA